MECLNSNCSHPFCPEHRDHLSDYGTPEYVPLPVQEMIEEGYSSVSLGLRAPLSVAELIERLESCESNSIVIIDPKCLQIVRPNGAPEWVMPLRLFRKENSNEWVATIFRNAR